MIVIGVALLVIGVVLAFLIEYGVLDIPYLLEQLLTFVSLACVILGLTLTVFALALPLVLSTPPEDIEPTEYSTNVQSEQSHCSFLGDACIIEEWSPICLIQKCIIDTRK